MSIQTRPAVRVDVPPPPSPGTPAVAAAGLALLDQCAGFVGRLGDAPYCGESATIKGGTIGKHVRHVLDHYRAALDHAARDGTIDYDHRERDVPMETDRRAALAAIAGVRDRLAALCDADLSRPVRVRVMLAGDGAEAELGSTLGRELAFATHHAVHHQAMLKAMAAEFGVEAGERFGKAPSTMHHEARHNSHPEARPR
ncbi:MAG: DinB family protein [Phycisphaerales bacterium]